MNTLGDVKQAVRSLLGDPDGDWLTDDYITPLINVKYRLDILDLKNSTQQNLESRVLILGGEEPGNGKVPLVVPGTTSLYPWQGKGQPLEGLTDPLEVWTKPAGYDPQHFAEGIQDTTLPHVSPRGLQFALGMSVVHWVWSGNQLLLTPVQRAIDYEIFGRRNPPPLREDDDVLIADPEMESVLACGAAAMIGIERSNPTVLAGYQQEHDAGISDIKAKIIRQAQGRPVRTGRMGREFGWYNGWRWN